MAPFPYFTLSTTLHRRFLPRKIRAGPPGAANREYQQVLKDLSSSIPISILAAPIRDSSELRLFHQVPATEGQFCNKLVGGGVAGLPPSHLHQASLYIVDENMTIAQHILLNTHFIQ